jgi:ankyrin
VTRILTDDFPRYFALVTKVKEEKQWVDEKGLIISSTVVPQVQAVFPEGAVNKKIKVGLQVSAPHQILHILTNCTYM